MTSAGIFRELIRYINPDIVCIILEFAERTLMDYVFPDLTNLEMLDGIEGVGKYNSFNEFLSNNNEESMGKFPMAFHWIKGNISDRLEILEIIDVVDGVTHNQTRTNLVPYSRVGRPKAVEISYRIVIQVEDKDYEKVYEYLKIFFNFL